jgi:hypothetical protein
MSRVCADMSQRASAWHGGMNVDESLGAPAATPERPSKAPFAARGLGGPKGARSAGLEWGYSSAAIV